MPTKSYRLTVMTFQEIGARLEAEARQRELSLNHLSHRCLQYIVDNDLFTEALRPRIERGDVHG